jgi:fumarate reductase iron-sulfur subunit
MKILSDHAGMWGCTFVGECTQVCPKHVDPAGAIQQFKLTGALDAVRSFLLPWGTK